MLLESLDAVIAFVTIMLVLSLMITALVQLAISVCGLRGRNVLWGLEQLFQSTLPAAKRGELEGQARRLAQRVLAHGTLSTSTNWLLRWVEKASGGRLSFNGGSRPPAALHLTDVKLVLSDLAADGELAAEIHALREAVAARLDPELESAVAETLAKRFPQQAAELDDAIDEIRSRAREIAAGVEVAARRLEDWFELTMDAAAEKLKLHSRWITVVFAVLIAFGLRVDSIGLMHQLFENPELTAQVLVQTAQVQATAADLQGGATDAGRAAVEELGKTVKELQATLGETGLVVFHPFDSFYDFLTFLCPFAERPSIPGVADPPGRLGCLATVLLLSLGAPFWSGALGELLGFRAILRKRRQTGGASGG